MRFEYSQNHDGTWSWQLRTAMGDLVATGASYGDRDNCLAAIKLVKLAAAASCRDVTPPRTRDFAVTAGSATRL